MFPGEMTVIGARPGVGKSAFGMHIALHAARAGASVCVCSREMTDVQYGQRLLGADLGPGRHGPAHGAAQRRGLGRALTMP